MEVIGYIASVFIGISLGLIGGGGSILTVPVLVYLFGITPEMSTAYSLFIVGITALVGSFRNASLGQIEYKTALVFAVPAFIAVYLTRRFLVPSIPDPVFSTEIMTLSKDTAIMVFFALIMLAASVSMIRSHKDEIEVAQKPIFNYPAIIIEGLLVGVLTGIVGAGGGFLIIPALVLFAKLPMKKAVGTSLLIITFKSLIGFKGDLDRPDLIIDWTLLLSISAIAIGGIFVGIYLTRFIDGTKLKKGFGWFVLAMAVYIILKQI